MTTVSGHLSIGLRHRAIALTAEDLLMRARELSELGTGEFVNRKLMTLN